MEQWIIHCKYDELLDPKSLKDNPDNSNHHPQDQIEDLSKILYYQGWRYAIKINKANGFIQSGHGRKLAAILRGQKTVPVVYQEYKDEDQARADLISDNAIAMRAELDFANINSQIPEFDPSFDLTLLGLKDFKLDPSEIKNSSELFEPKQEYILVMNFKNEYELQNAYERFSSEGIECKIIT